MYDLNLEKMIQDLDTAVAAADAAVSHAETAGEAARQGTRQAASAGRTVLTILRSIVGRMKLAAVVAPPVEAAIHADLAVPSSRTLEPVQQELAPGQVFFCKAANCRGLGWQPRPDFPHPRTCLPDDQQAAWPGACGLAR